ncbi:MAG: ABC transporter ATP-binding protein [Thermomicrobiales bacterium]
MVERTSATTVKDGSAPPLRQGGVDPASRTSPTPDPRPLTPIVSMHAIHKRFGPTRANDDVSLALREGEIHAVLGENGAGKTTLMNILAGMYHPDAGTIAIRGQAVSIASPADALRQGIGTVYQHFTLVPNLSIIENVVLGMKTSFVLDLAQAERRLTAMLGAFELAASPRTEVRHLSLGERQRVEIVKALFRGSRVLLLDEPTSVLTPVEVDGLFTILRRLRAEGVAVVLITHKLEEALGVSDRVTVLRQGRNVGELPPEDLAGADRAAIKERIVGMMFGGGASATPAQEATPASARATTVGRPLLTLRGVSAGSDRGTPAVRGISVAFNAGEVFGIAGVDGNGQKELGEVIAGQRPTAAGSVALDGQDLTNRGVAAAVRAGVGYVTDDRLGEGVAPGFSVAENVVLKKIGRAPFSRRFWLNRGAIDAHARELIGEYNVKTPGAATRMSLLSGGNIQKVLLARELSMDPRVIVCNKPTNGLDLKTAQFVMRALRAEADKGKAVVLISSELDEILEISDRIGVMYNGELVAVFPRAAADPETIGHLMLSGVSRPSSVPDPRPPTPDPHAPNGAST